MRGFSGSHKRALTSADAGRAAIDAFRFRYRTARRARNAPETLPGNVGDNAKAEYGAARGLR